MNSNNLQILFLVITGVALIAIVIIYNLKSIKNYIDQKNAKPITNKESTTERFADTPVARFIEEEKFPQPVKIRPNPTRFIDEEKIGQPTKMRPNPNVQEEFTTLRFFVGLIKTVAIFTAILGYVLSGIFIAGGIKSSLFGGFSVVGGIVGILVSTIIAILIYSYGDFIQCVVDIEHNTRQTAFNTRRNDDPT